MLSAEQLRAVELLFRLPPDDAAHEMGLQPATIRRWMRQPEFSGRLTERLRERSEAATRAAADLVLAAALRVRKALETPDGSPDRASLDILKASGIFEKLADADEDGETLAEIIARCAAGYGEGQ